MDNDLVVTVELLNTVRNRYDVMHSDASGAVPRIAIGSPPPDRIRTTNMTECDPAAMRISGIDPGRGERRCIQRCT